MIRVDPGLEVDKLKSVRSGLKKQGLNSNQKPDRSDPGLWPGCQEVQEMSRLLLAS
jgi:hypothetical protein